VKSSATFVESVRRHRTCWKQFAKIWLVVWAWAGVRLYAQDQDAESGHRSDACDASELASCPGRVAADTGPAQPAPSSEDFNASDDSIIRDGDIQAAVEAILKNSGLAVDDLGVRVDKGVVFISGTSKSWQAKEDAPRLIWNTPGVTGIVNDIQVNARFSVVPLEE